MSNELQGPLADTDPVLLKLAIAAFLANFGAKGFLSLRSQTARKFARAHGIPRRELTRLRAVLEARPALSEIDRAAHEEAEAAAFGEFLALPAEAMAASTPLDEALAMTPGELAALLDEAKEHGEDSIE